MKLGYGSFQLYIVCEVVVLFVQNMSMPCKLLAASYFLTLLEPYSSNKGCRVTVYKFSEKCPINLYILFANC